MVVYPVIPSVGRLFFFCGFLSLVLGFQKESKDWEGWGFYWWDSTGDDVVDEM